ncbi:type II toxin-antitoxin system death-on-curing family toxin [Candidatus Pyrohabitans sp.]
MNKSKEVKVTPDVIETLFDEMLLTMEIQGETILNRGIIDMATFKVNKQRDVFDQAAMAMFEIAAQHAFSDGNKRMAYLLAETILYQKNFKIKCNPDSCIKLLVKIAQNKATLKEVKKWIRKHAVKIEL